jgi:hypothetical protein
MAIGKKSISLPIRLSLGAKGLSFERADIKFTGIEQAGKSFEGRVFLNNPSADENTPTTAEQGYAGSFHVYGFGLSSADFGKSRSNRDKIQAPIEKTVIATDAIRAAATRSTEIVVTVVPVYPGQPPSSASDAMTLKEARIDVQ